MAEPNDPRHTAHSPPGPPRGPSPTGPPARVGRFEVRRALGRGAFGEVLLAYDPDLAREVALKLPRDVELTDAVRTAFLKEARAVAAIHHPNVCPVYEAGTHDGTPYIVMRYVPGGTLAGAIRAAGRGLAPRAAVRFAHKIALGLVAAHAKGLVHRDLKPANVLCDDATGELLIADFGLARALDRSVASTAGVKGTPLYMPPEQWSSAHWGPVGAHSDVYALGCILFELLTGEPPFVGGPMEVMFAHCQTPAPRPSAARPGLPRGLDAICLKAMAKRGADRFRSAQEFANALGAYLSGPQFEVVPPPVPAPKPPPLPPTAGSADTGGPGETATEREVVRCPGCRSQLQVRAGRTKPVTCPRCALVFGLTDARAAPQHAPRRPTGADGDEGDARPAPRRPRRRDEDEAGVAPQEWAPVAGGMYLALVGLFLAVASLVLGAVLASDGTVTKDTAQVVGVGWAMSFALVAAGRWRAAGGPDERAAGHARLSALAALGAALCFAGLASGAEALMSPPKRGTDDRTFQVLAWTGLAGASLLPPLSELAFVSCLVALGRVMPDFPGTLASAARLLIRLLFACAIMFTLSGLWLVSYFMTQSPLVLKIAAAGTGCLVLTLAPLALIIFPWLYIAATRAVGRYARGEA